jgi:hypothetical protein
MHALVAACQWRSCPVMQLHPKSLTGGLEEATIYSILEEAYKLGQSLRCAFQGFLPLYSLYQSHFLLQQSSALAKREFELHL